jgi:hypothetical protein
MAFLTRLSGAAELQIEPELIAECIDACQENARVCLACADACLSELDTRGLTRCIRLCLDCAEISATASHILARQAGHDTVLLRAMLQLCVIACMRAGDECAHHALRGLDQCRRSAESCRRNADLCNQLLASLD